LLCYKLEAFSEGGMADLLPRLKEVRFSLLLANVFLHLILYQAKNYGKKAMNSLVDPLVSNFYLFY
jgi:hypothetical protein